MTLEDTRRLGIEFERRVQTMIPEKELSEKLDTDTIYSYLNLYQDKYIHEIYRNLDGIASGSKLQTHIDSVLQPLLHSATVALSDNGVLDNVTDFTDDNGIEIIDSARSVVYPLPEDFYMYVKSVSRVDKTFSFRAGSNENDGKIRILPNILLSQNDLLKVIETPHDSLRILRYPVASLTGSYTDYLNKSESNLANNILKGVAGSNLYDTDNATNVYKGKLNIDANGNVVGSEDTSATEYTVFVANGVITEQQLTDEEYTEAVGEIDPSDLDNYLADGIYLLETESGFYVEDSGELYDVTSQLLENVDNYIVLCDDDVYVNNSKLNITKGQYKRSLTVIYDQYTGPMGVKVTYYREPKHFDIMTSTACELPIDAFEELVSGAVDLYVQYVAGAEARRKQLEEARRQAAKEQEANNARRGRNSE